MNDRKRILIYSLLILVCSVWCATGITLTILYQTSFEETRAHLVEIARGQARFMEAVARFDAINSQDAHPEGAAEATLTQIADARQHHQGFGETGEFVLAQRQGDQIVFLFPYRHGDGGDPDPVSWASDLAEPMRRDTVLRAASAQGRMDAFSAWEPTPTIALARFEKPAVIQRNTTSGYSYFSRSLADRHPEAVRQIVASQWRSTKRLRNQKENRFQAARWALAAGQGGPGIA